MNPLNNGDLRSRIEENSLLVLGFSVLSVFLLLYLLQSRAAQRASVEEQRKTYRRKVLIASGIAVGVVVLVLLSYFLYRYLKRASTAPSI